MLKLTSEYQIPPDPRFFMAAASACARHGQWKTVISLFGACVLHDI